MGGTRAGPGKAAFVSPLRDLAIKDLALFCHQRGLEQVRRRLRMCWLALGSPAVAPRRAPC